MAEELEGVEEEREVGAPDIVTSRKSSMETPMRPNEDRIVEWVEGLYTDAKMAKDDQCEPDTWPKDLATWWGEQWTGQIPTYKPRIVVNEIKSLGLQELSDLTDSKIKIFVQKDKKSTDRDTAAEDSIQTFWRTQYCDLTVLSAALDAIVYPLGFIQTGFDPLAEQGQGEVIYQCRDPITVFPDGDAEDDKLSYFLFEDILDLMQIRRDHPETGTAVEPEASYSTKAGGGTERASPRAGSGYVGPMYSKTGLGGTVPGWKKARVRHLTCVVDDDEKVEEINSIGGQLRQRSLLKYPHRRMILVANRRVLYDDDCPYWYAPILTRVMLQPTVHSYWPRASIVSEFSEIQSAANKMDSMVVESGLRLNAGLIFADANSGINPKTWAPIPGLVTLRREGSKIDVVYPNPMPPDMVNGGERLRGFIRSTLGYPLSRTGAGTHGNVAAELAETEISQAMGLTRLRGRLLHQCVQKSVQMIFARMAQFYTTPRHLPYVEDGELKSARWEPVAKPEEYAVHVDPSSFEVRSQTMMQRIHLALAKMNKMPTGRLLKALKIPDADKVAEELKQELILQAMARQRQARGKSK